MPEEQTFLAKAQKEKLRKLSKRMQGLQLQIPLQSKKDKGKSLRALTGSRIKIGRLAKGVKSSDKSKSAPNSSSRADRAACRGAKRNLDFDSVAVGGDRRKSPRKRAAITTLSTPAKKRQMVTPKKKLTPGKRHAVLVPETPTAKDLGRREDAQLLPGCHGERASAASRRRKTDGTTQVKESPDLRSAKYPEAVPVTPRTLRARDSLRRKTFYPDNQVNSHTIYYVIGTFSSTLPTVVVLVGTYAINYLFHGQ